MSLCHHHEDDGYGLVCGKCAEDYTHTLEAQLAEACKVIEAWMLFIDKSSSVVRPERMTREYYEALHREAEKPSPVEE